MKPWSLSLVALAALGTAAFAQDARPQLPPPEATDPVTLGIMKGFPPPPDKRVTLGNVLKYPNGRWAYHHLRELGPTANIWRGTRAPSALQENPRPLDMVAFADDKEQQTTIADWQKATYTDALLVL